MSDLADEPAAWPVLDSKTAFRGAVVSVRTDEVEAPDGSRHVRDVVVHPGAVAVVALDSQDRVLVIRHYRHPVGVRAVELPAGLLDVTGEPAIRAAQRELAEEALLQATHWSPLVEVNTSTGMTTERVHIFLAEHVSTVAAPEHFEAHAEELDLDPDWVPLPDLVDNIIAGRVANSLLIAGVLTLWARRTRSAF